MVMVSDSAAPPTRGPYSDAVPGCRRMLAQVEPAEYAAWDGWCESHPNRSFFHSAEWMKVLAETYGFNPAYLILRVEGRPRFMFPVLEVKTVGRRKGVSLPFTDFCEPLLWDAADAEMVWEQIIDWGKMRMWRSLQWRGGCGFVAQSSPSLSFFGHVLDLTPSEVRLYEDLDPAVRRAIRKAEREGVKTEISEGIEAVRNYYDLHCQTRKRHGLPPQPFRFFRKIHEHVISKGLGFVVTATHRGRPVAGAVFFQFARKALFKFGASDHTSQSLRANDLVMWSAIKQFARNGYSSLHFGRTAKSNEGLRRFKRGWGAAEHEIQYFKFDFQHSTFVREQDRVFGWHNGLFAALPLWVARVLGSLFYKRFA